MGTHDEYGKDLCNEILGGRWANWFSEAERSVTFASVAAKLDGVIKNRDLSAIECAVEIEATNVKQIRGALVGLAQHPAPKKLFVVIKAQGEVQKRSDAEILEYCFAVWGMLTDKSSANFKAVVLSGTGEFRQPEADKEILRTALRELGVT